MQETAHIVRAWEIRLDRIPQLRKIATDNNLDSAPLIIYEALSHLMSQWLNTFTWSATALNEETIPLNELSRPYLALHANSFLESREIPSKIATSIKPVLQLTREEWTTAERVLSAKSELRKLIDHANHEYTGSKLYKTARNYSTNHEAIVSPYWNTFLKTKYGIDT